MCICKFCGKEKKLIGAHIIPRKFYIGLKNDTYLDINTKTGKYKILQKGNYVSNILCGDCDNNVLGKFDQEGYRILLNDFSKYKKIPITPNFTLYEVPTNCFDYRKLRNFFISVLWRASVATSKEWLCINLGPYEKKAFEILKGKNEHPDLFKILIYKSKYNGELNSEVGISKMKEPTYKAYIIQMAGYLIKVIVDSRRLTKEYKYRFEKYFLSPQHVYISETTEVDRKIYSIHNEQMQKLDNIGFIPPKPKSNDGSK